MRAHNDDLKETLVRLKFNEFYRKIDNLLNVKSNVESIGHNKAIKKFKDIIEAVNYILNEEKDVKEALINLKRLENMLEANKQHLGLIEREFLEYIKEALVQINSVAPEYLQPNNNEINQAEVNAKANKGFSNVSFKLQQMVGSKVRPKLTGGLLKKQVLEGVASYLRQSPKSHVESENTLHMVAEQVGKFLLQENIKGAERILKANLNKVVQRHVQQQDQYLGVVLRAIKQLDPVFKIDEKNMNFLSRGYFRAKAINVSGVLPRQNQPKNNLLNWSSRKKDLNKKNTRNPAIVVHAYETKKPTQSKKMSLDKNVLNIIDELYTAIKNEIGFKADVMQQRQRGHLLMLIVELKRNNENRELSDVIKALTGVLEAKDPIKYNPHRKQVVDALEKLIKLKVQVENKSKDAPKF